MVLTGVDTFHLGLHGDVPPGVFARVLDAQREPGEEDRVLELAGRLWTVGRGTQWHAAWLQHGPLKVGLTRPAPGLGKNPALAFEVECRALWRDGVETAWRDCEAVGAAIFGEPARRAGLTRVDLAVDVAGPRFELAAREEWVCPRLGRPTDVGDDPDEATWARWYTRSHPNSMRWGTGDLVVRCYDKTREIDEISPGKAWFHDLWQASPDYKGGPVWRVEAQLRRAALKGLAVDERGEPLRDEEGRALSTDTHAGFEAALPVWWRRVVGEAREDPPFRGAVRWATPRGERRDRWPTRPEWRVIQGAADRFASSTKFAGRGWIPAAQRRADAEALLPQVVGLLVRYGVEKGITDPHAAVEAALEDALAHLERKGTTWEARALALAVELAPEVIGHGAPVPVAAAS